MSEEPKKPEIITQRQIRELIELDKRIAEMEAKKRALEAEIRGTNGKNEQVQ